MKIELRILQIIKLTCRSIEEVDISNQLLFDEALRSILWQLEDWITEELDFLRNGKIRTIKSQ